MSHLPAVPGALVFIWLSIHDGAHTTAKSPLPRPAVHSDENDCFLAEMPDWNAFSVRSNAALTWGFVSYVTLWSVL